MSLRCVLALLALVGASAAGSEPELQVAVELLPADCSVKSKHGDMLTMHYTGTLDDGTKFDSSTSQAHLSEQITETVRTIRATSPVTKCVVIRTEIPIIDDSYVQKIQQLKETLNQFEHLSTSLCIDQSKQTSIEIEQLNARVVEAETKLKTEVTRIKKKLQIQITELELSLDVANKTNIDLQKTIKKQSLQNVSIRLEEVEANAIVGGKRIMSQLEARIKDMELELDEEKRRHAETIKILRKKERSLKEVMIQCEEDQKNIVLLQDSLEKTSQKVNIYKRPLQEQEGMSQQSVTRVRRFQRELEAAEDRADVAESNLKLIRAKHRTLVTTSTVPGSQVYLVQESRELSTE